MSASLEGMSDIVSGPILSQVGKHEMTITWETTHEVAGAMAYWPSSSGAVGAVVAPSTTCTLSTDTIRHQVRLTDLLPGRVYVYALVLNGQRLSPEYRFQTEAASATSFTFLAYGDTQDNEWHGKVRDAMMRHQDAALVLHVGDLVYLNGRFMDQWRDFLRMGAPLLARFPFYPILGNHDEQAGFFYEYFDRPSSKPWYSFDYGTVHFIGLDTNHPYGPGSQQYEWLLNDLATSEQRWKVAFFHHPPYSPVQSDNTMEVREFLIPLFEKYGVAIVLSGHTHVFEHYEENSVHYFLIGGGGGYMLTYEKSSYEAPFHYVKVDITEDALILEAILPDGNLVDRFRIEPPKAEASSGAA